MGCIHSSYTLESVGEVIVHNCCCFVASARNGRGKSGQLEKADRGSLLASIRSGKKLAKVDVEKV